MNAFLDVVLIVLKCAIAMGMLLHLAAIVTWFERKGSALIQDRMGANRAGFFGFDLAGIFNTLVADPVKAITKEDFVPKGVSQFLHSLAPFMGVFPVIVSFAVIPLGPSIHIAGGYVDIPFINIPLIEPFYVAPREISLQVAGLNVGVLYVFAMGSLAVYGAVLGGWVANNKFSLLGGLRSSAQMISYEVTMGISLIGVIAAYQTLDLNKIIEYQSGTILGFLPKWGIFMMFPFNIIAFLVFFVSMMAETKRAPFDLPESESELVAGYLTEFSGMKFLLFWLGEFAEIVVASCLFAVLFFGGWQLPFFDITSLPSDSPLMFYLGAFGMAGAVGFVRKLPLRIFFAVLTLLMFLLGKYLSPVLGQLGFQWGPIIGLHVFGAKVAIFCMLQVIIRWSLPRFRYDQLMNLCWKGMLPVSIVNLVVTVFLILSGYQSLLEG